MFTSALYGFKLALPPGSEGVQATITWTSGAIEGICETSAWDCFPDMGDGRQFEVAAIDVGASTTLEDWQSQVDATTPPQCSDTGSPTETVLSGERAFAWDATCASEGLDAIDLVALHGARGYLVILTSPTSNSVSSDHAAFDALLSGFQFTTSGA